jgi:probable rRNA maturation factor
LDTVDEPGGLEVEVVKALRVPVPPATIRNVVRRAAALPEVLARLPAGSAAVVFRLTDDAELQRLNRTFAGEDSITDVLSFAGWGNHLGDVAISWPAVVRQAAQYGHSAQVELGLLCVHGLLHLLGWDHASAGERKEMSRITGAALQLSGLTLAPGRL